MVEVTGAAVLALAVVSLHSCRADKGSCDVRLSRLFLEACTITLLNAMGEPA